MGSDRARITYDPKQQCRSVVMQQGRVTLEADWNEASQIIGEELRRETLDFVGPCGTPDNGYLVVPYGFSFSTTYNQIQFLITTGSDDLRSDSSATATLLDSHGALIQVVTLKSQNQAGWSNNSTQTVVASLSSPLKAAHRTRRSNSARSPAKSEIRMVRWCSARAASKCPRTGARSPATCWRKNISARPAFPPR